MSRGDIEKIDHIIDWYDQTKEWLNNYAGTLHRVAKGEISAEILVPSSLFLTTSEIDESKNKKLDCLSTATSLKLFAAFEGALRFDTKNRHNKGKVGKDFKSLIRRTNKNLKDIEVSEIIDCWCNYYSINKSKVSILKGLFKYRHWLAHGRYWDNVGYPVHNISAITPEFIHKKMRFCFNEFHHCEDDFEW